MFFFVNTVLPLRLPSGSPRCACLGATVLFFHSARSLLHASGNLDTSSFHRQYVFFTASSALPMHHVHHLIILESYPLLIPSTQTALYNRAFRVACCRCMLRIGAAAASEFEYALEERAKCGNASYDHADAILGVTPQDHLRYTIWWGG